MLMILARLVRSESFWAVVKVRSPHTGPEVSYPRGGRPIASPRNVLGHGQRLSRLAAAAGPPLHRLTLNSTHRTQSQNTAPDATHGHGLLRLGHRHLA